MTNSFVDKVSEQISDKHSRELITAELESHLLDKIDYYVDIGYSKEEAEKRATEEMGNPEDTAVPLNSLHHKKHRAVPIIICACLLLLMFIFSYKFFTDFHYTLSSLAFSHRIWLDFISLGYVVAYPVMLIYAHKKNEKIIPVLVVISFCLQLIAPSVEEASSGLSNDEPLNMVCVYQPFFYSVIKIFAEGFPAYLKCIFTAAPARYSVLGNFCYEIMPYILCAIFILWSTILFFNILRKEQMTNTKSGNLYLKIFEKAMTIIIVLNLIIVSCSTAFVGIKSLVSNNTYSSKKQEMIDYVFDTNLKNNLSNLADSIENDGYYLYEKSFDEDEKYCDYYDIGGSFVLRSSTYENDDGKDGIYTSLTYYDTYSHTYDNTPEILSDANKIKNIDIGTSFDYIKNSDLLKYADIIEKTYYEDKKETEIIINFSVDVYDKDISIENNYSCFRELTIKNGVVTNSNYW